MQKQKYQAYATATQTVARTKQIVMLYDGAIRFIQQAREAIQHKRVEARYNALIKASEVITGLQSCLDFENGGQIAKVLYSFYGSVDSRIFSIHRTSSIETCDEVVGDLKKMRDVWSQIDESTADTASPAAPVAEPPPPGTPDQNIIISA